MEETQSGGEGHPDNVKSWKHARDKLNARLRADITDDNPREGDSAGDRRLARDFERYASTFAAFGIGSLHDLHLTGLSTPDPARHFLSSVSAVGKDAFDE